MEVLFHQKVRIVVHRPNVGAIPFEKGDPEHEHSQMLETNHLRFGHKYAEPRSHHKVLRLVLLVL